MGVWWLGGAGGKGGREERGDRGKLVGATLPPASLPAAAAADQPADVP